MRKWEIWENMKILKNIHGKRDNDQNDDDNDSQEEEEESSINTDEDSDSRQDESPMDTEEEEDNDSKEESPLDTEDDEEDLKHAKHRSKDVEQAKKYSNHQSQGVRKTQKFSHHRSKGVKQVKNYSNQLPTDGYKPNEKEQWCIILKGIIENMKVNTVEDIYKDPEQFKTFLKGIKRHTAILDQMYNGIFNGMIMPQLKQEFHRLRDKHGYSYDEAHDAIWFNRRYLFKRLLKDCKGELASLFSNGIQ